ncbi:hypothetical protein QO034_18890 [Sedimentitalea sp. JM2-8]|uniref:Uncharacterized protein n=1 Tax=Sedimentitalea xiamensis TaxID=3050037 RepID=A0ABT7FJ55_9RHOB|nr:hypothetical protein [Sedimentitalea xiamensis]MDK3075159.1 hypothetical protein [Sedimentitalea xiamensis]
MAFSSVNEVLEGERHDNQERRDRQDCRQMLEQDVSEPLADRRFTDKIPRRFHNLLPLFWWWAGP